MKAGMKKSREKTEYLPKRSCVVCRRKDVKASFLKLVLENGVIITDTEGRRPGRSAYVCRDPECLSRLSAKHLSRAWKCPVSKDWVSDLFKESL